MFDFFFYCGWIGFVGPEVARLVAGYTIISDGLTRLRYSKDWQNISWSVQQSVPYGSITCSVHRFGSEFSRLSRISRFPGFSEFPGFPGYPGFPRFSRLPRSSGVSRISQGLKAFKVTSSAHDWSRYFSVKRQSMEEVMSSRTDQVDKPMPLLVKISPRNRLTPNQSAITLKVSPHFSHATRPLVALLTTRSSPKSPATHP